MAHYSIVVLALFMIACGPRSEHPSGTCSGSAGIAQAGSYTPPPITDAGGGDAMVRVGEPSNDAGLNGADATPDQQSGDSG